MNIVKWKKNVDFVTNAQAKLGNVNDTHWKSFLDALGKIEGNDQYNNLNGQGYVGIYQFASFNNPNTLFIDLGYKDNVGAMLGVGSDEQYKSNPVAQELSALMEFRNENRDRFN